MSLICFLHCGFGAVAERNLFRHDDVQDDFQRAALVWLGENGQTLPKFFVCALSLFVRRANFLAGNGDG